MTQDERDQRIAKELFGWEWKKPRHGTCCTCQRCGRGNEYECDGDNSCDYSNSIGSAWRIVDKLKEFGYAPQIFTDSPVSEWKCAFVFDQFIIAEASHKDVCMAISLAAIEYLNNRESFENSDGE